VILSNQKANLQKTKEGMLEQKGESMTQLLQEAFTLITSQLTPQGQDTLAHLMIDHLEQLPDFLAEELEEQQFEASARQAIQSDNVQHLLKQVAEKYQANHSVISTGP